MIIGVERFLLLNIFVERGFFDEQKVQKNSIFTFIMLQNICHFWLI